LTYTGPYQNIHPDVGYVGDAVCAKCHRDKAESYRQHPMGRSLAPVAQTANQLPYDKKHHNPFPALESVFRVERDSGRIWHVEERFDAAGKTIFLRDHEAQFVIGSGTRGASYLTVRAGFVLQTPISWYAQKRIWDLSPGFGEAHLSGRLVPPLCLYCHTNRAIPRDGWMSTRYEEPVFGHGHAIGCERCHGPGERHVANPGEKTNGIDYTIVHPGKLPWRLREAVCEQCHLEGEQRVVRRGRELHDHRPGLPLEDFWSIYVLQRRTDEEKAVNHAEQMHLSKCFQASPDDKKLGCVSCHDPHVRVGPKQRVAHYRQACLACHDRAKGQRECSVATRQDSCIDCHMPRYQAVDIVHTAATSHHIVRRKGKGKGHAPGRPAALMRFHPAPADEQERKRDLGIALGQQAVKTGSQADAERAVSLLEGALANAPDDVRAWAARGAALSVLGSEQEVLLSHERVLALAPRDELALASIASIYQARQQHDKAIPYWRRLIKVTPWSPRAREALARALAAEGDWHAVRGEALAWLRLDPASVDAHRLWIEYLLKRGDRAGARAEFDVVRRLRPKNLPALEKWFAHVSR
jgi:predicted CXXCH cytochrome family protein